MNATGETVASVGNDLGTVLAGLTAIAATLGRDDAVQQLAGLQAQVSRATTYVVVLGEFKQGKSSLLNALVDAPLCPVDDDVATCATTIVRHADTLEASVLVSGAEQSQPIPPTAARAAALAGHHQGATVERVEFGVPSSLTAAGITLVDTPGVGGLRSGHTLAAASFLPFADAVLFVSDATAEFSASELEWFRTAVERCGIVVPVLTKVDLVPAWRTVLELDTGHLATIGSTSSVIACSAATYEFGSRVADDDLVASSNVPMLRALLAKRVADPARQRAQIRAAVKARAVARSLMEQVRNEFALAAEPDGEQANRLHDEQRSLQALRSAGSKWAQVLNDTAGDIANASSFQFRAAMRTLGQSLDARIETMQSADDWDGFSSAVQHEMADAVAAVFAEVDRRFDELRHRLYEIVGDDGVGVDGGRSGSVVDVSAFFATTALDAAEVGRKGSAMQAVRSAQSGLMMFGFLGQLLPAAGAALLLSSPITIALGGYFAGKALLDVRKRALSTRRTQLKQGVRKVIDDAQFELSNRVAELTRTSTRSLRDEINEAITLAIQTRTEALEQAKQHVAADTTARAARGDELRRIAEQLKALDAALGASVPAVSRVTS
ncbi:MAG: dynamin family protein [Actinomycetota bacterium]